MQPACIRHTDLPGTSRLFGDFVYRFERVASFYQHNPQVTLMRTTPDECAQLGKIIAEKVNASRGPVTVLIPKRAISVISAAGEPFHSPDADAALRLGAARHAERLVARSTRGFAAFAACTA